MLVAAALTVSTLASAVVIPGAAHAAVPTGPPKTPVTSGVELDLTVDPLGGISLGKDVAATATVTNFSLLPVQAGTIEIYLTDERLASRSELSDWLQPTGTADVTTGSLVATAQTEVLDNGVTRFPVTIKKESLEARAGGVYGLMARFITGSDSIAEDTTSVVVRDPDVGSIGVAVAFPLTVPASTRGLIPAEALEEYTGSDGILTRKLDAVLRRPVAIALDPMIVTSIRILGDAAPVSSQSWLSRLASAPNQIFPLSYADADIAVQSQAGIPLLAPTSFEYAVNEDLFAQEPSAPVTPTPPTPSTTDTGSPSPEPTPDAEQPPRPTLKSLTSWKYTAHGIGWPADGTVVAHDLPVFNKNGITTTILSGSNVINENAGVTPSAHSSIGDNAFLVADGDLTAAFRAATSAQTVLDWTQAMAEFSAQLALVQAEEASDARTVLVTLGRDEAGLGRLGQSVDALGELPWARTATLSDVVSTPPGSAYSIKDNPESEKRIAALSDLHSRASQVADLSTVVKNPELLNGRYRADVLALLATAWLANPVEWQEEVSVSLTETAELLNGVRLGPMSDVLMASGQTAIPVTVINDLPLPVTVRVQTIPSNARLTVDDDVTAEIEAGSQAKVLIPVTARVANGDVALRIELHNNDMSVTLDGPAFVSVQVHADWETLGMLILAVLVIGFFAFGLWRNITRRRNKSGDASQKQVEARDD